jgi:hypothetical protein
MLRIRQIGTVAQPEEVHFPERRHARRPQAFGAPVPPMMTRPSLFAGD